MAILSTTEQVTWARTADAGDYLARYEDDGTDEVSDSGSRCGYGDDELAAIKARLARRGLTLAADDIGLRVEAV